MDSAFISGKTAPELEVIVPSPTLPEPDNSEKQEPIRRESIPKAKVKANVYNKETPEEAEDAVEEFPETFDKDFKNEYVKFYFDFRKVGDG